MSDHLLAQCWRSVEDIENSLFPLDSAGYDLNFKTIQFRFYISHH